MVFPSQYTPLANLQQFNCTVETVYPLSRQTEDGVVNRVRHA